MTGARVRRALPYITSENFALTYGDGVADIDVKAELEFHKSTDGRRRTPCARPHASGKWSSANLEHVSDFQGKAGHAAGRINGGVYILKRAGLEMFLQPADDKLIWEREPLEQLARAKQLKAFQHPGSWQPMDTYREFELLNKLWAEGKAFWKVW